MKVRDGFVNRFGVLNHDLADKLMPHHSAMVKEIQEMDLNPAELRLLSGDVSGWLPCDISALTVRAAMKLRAEGKEEEHDGFINNFGVIDEKVTGKLMSLLRSMSKEVEFMGLSPVELRLLCGFMGDGIFGSIICILTRTALRLKKSEEANDEGLSV